MATQQWTAHNIKLSDEITTMPGQPDFMKTDLRLKAILRALSMLYSDQTSLRVADLGCLEGGFSLALAERGMDVTAVEARRSNLEKCLLLKEHFGLSNLEFLRDDVKTFSVERFGTFDVVLTLGILYHLDQPILWLRQIAELTRTILIVESHYAPADKTSLRLIDPRISKLGPLERKKIDGTTYEGRWFFEYGPTADRESMPWASFSNSSSFWLTKESLLLGLIHAGFDLVLEQHDYSASSYEFFTRTFPRGLFLAIKNGGRDPANL